MLSRSLRSPLASSFALACAAALVLGALIRARPVVLADFPLNDGGLFYLMADEVRNAGYALPAFTDYNSARIPFAYPPFGFYAAAAISDITSVELIQVVRILPLVTTWATLLAFLLLARSMLRAPLAIAAAVAAFALTPRSFIWLVMGGGLTRAFGFLFTILALHQAYLLFTRRELRFALSAGLFTGLTPISHLGTAPFLAVSLLVFLIAYGRHREGLLGIAVIGVVAIAVSAPWWVTVIREHGIAPFLAARETGGSILSPGRPRDVVIGRLARLGAFSTGEPLFPVIGVLAVLGALAAVRSKMITLPAWWVIALAADARAGATYATVPAALLAGVAVAAILAPLLSPQSVVTEGHQRDVPFARRHALTAMVAGFFIVYGAASALTRDSDLGAEAAYLSSLTRDERDAMRWVATNTPRQSEFFVVPETPWPSDKAAEWFPVLAERISVATVQGREWLPDDSFARYEKLYGLALGCGGQGPGCLDQWADSSGRSFSHVFIPKSRSGPCCRRLSAALQKDDRYAQIFDGPGGEVFARRDREPGARDIRATQMPSQ